MIFLKRCVCVMTSTAFIVFNMLGADNAAVATHQVNNTKTVQKNLIKVQILGLDHKSDVDLKKNVQNIISIGAFNQKEAPDKARLDWLYAEGFSEIQSGLEPYGYYQSKITGSMIQDINQSWQVQYQVDKGQPIKINDLVLTLTGEGATDNSLARIIRRSKLKKNADLNHADYEKTKDDLQETAQSRGYFESHFSNNVVLVDPIRYQADVNLQMTTGMRYQLGQVNFKGGRLHSQFLQRFIPFNPGTPYLDETLLALQGDLVASDYFEEVLINSEPEIGQRQVPVNVDLSMRKKQFYSAGIGFSTDTGPRVRGNIEWRYLNQWGHKLKTDLVIAQKKQHLGLLYIVPGKKPLTDQYDFFINLESENTRSQNYTVGNIGIAAVRERGSMKHRHSLEYRYDRFESDEDWQHKVHTKLFMPTLSWSWKNDDNLRFRETGFSFSGMVRGSSDALFSDISFIQTKGMAKFYFPFKRNHRLIARVEGGITLLAKNSDFQYMPTALRFFAGGDTSVRGYALDAIGPIASSAATNPQRKKIKILGGKNLLVASLEYEYRVMKDISIAGFIDVGDAFNGRHWKPKTGFGIGGRWYSPIGAVRLDIAHGLNKKLGDNFRLHLTIGADL